MSKRKRESESELPNKEAKVESDELDNDYVDMITLLGEIDYTNDK